MQKRLLGAASLGVAALLMSACGGQSPAPAATGDAAASSTTTPAATSTTTGAPVRDANVDLVIWADADRAAILQKFADQFGQEQGIKVQIQVSTDVRKDFKAATDVGKGPDIIVGAHDWLGELVQNGAVKPVNLSADQRRCSSRPRSRPPSSTASATACPTPSRTSALMRNTALAPTRRRSFEDMIAKGKALKDARQGHQRPYPAGRQDR